MWDSLLQASLNHIIRPVCRKNLQVFKVLNYIKANALK
jgi:hypothetical protein